MKKFHPKKIDYDQQAYLEYMEKGVEELNDWDKIEFARSFIEKKLHIDCSSDNLIKFDNLHTSTLQYLIYSVISMYEDWLALKNKNGGG